MIKFRELSTLTEEEANFILLNILKLEPLTKLTNVCGIVDIETKVGDYLLEIELLEQEGYTHISCMELFLTDSGIKKDYHITINKRHEIRHYLFSLGMSSLLKDNKYLKEAYND